jgi:murein L,D-transpeptidase YafK
MIRFLLIAIPTIAALGFFLHRYDRENRRPKSQQPPAEVAEQMTPPESREGELTPSNKKNRPPDKRSSPLLRKIPSIITDYFKNKPSAEELEQQRLANMDIPTLLEEKGLKSGTPVFIRAFKEERELELFLKAADGTFKLLRTYPIAAASGKLGPKIAEGDMQVPEGFYASSQRSMKPDSDFHLAFNIGYPNAYDRAHDRTGSFIMVHGSNVSIGCLAMTDPKIEEIYSLCQAALDAGQPFFRIHIFPFRMTDKRMQQAASSQHYDFWKNLKTGHDLFENTRIPPDVWVRGKEYFFE